MLTGIMHMPSAGTKNVCHSEQPPQSAHNPVDATAIAALPSVMPVPCGPNKYHSEQPSQLAHSEEITIAAPSPTVKPMHRSVLCVKAREPNPNHSAERPFLSISPTTAVNGASILAFQLPAAMLLPEVNDSHLPSTYTIREYDAMTYFARINRHERWTDQAEEAHRDGDIMLDK